MNPRTPSVRRAWLALTPALLVTLLGADRASAADEFELSRYGARIGFSSSPDQFTIGAYAQLGQLAPRLSMRPSLDFGFGDHLTSIIGNADVQYSFESGASFVPFVGGGLGIGYYSFDTPDNLPPGVSFDSSTTEVGLNLYGGIEFDLGGYKSGYAEARVGIDDLPDFKLTVGLGFY